MSSASPKPISRKRTATWPSTPAKAQKKPPRFRTTNSTAIMKRIGAWSLLGHRTLDIGHSLGLCVFGCLGISLSLALADNPSSSPIPPRPEQLQFPPLNYEPPKPADYRVPLKSGPIAYIAPDRDLPLVQISILIRAGDYVEPAKKEGLAGFTGNLLSRGGTKSKTAEELEERLAFLAANLSSGFGDTQGSV